MLNYTAFIKNGWVYVKPILKVGYLLGLGNESDFVLGLNTAACELEFTIRLPCASLRLGVLSHSKNIKVNMTSETEQQTIIILMG